MITEQQLKTLREIGLNKIQIELYLMSLKNGILSVLELSKLTKINRQQIYKEAEKLVELGLYDVTRKQGRKYIPAHPSKLIAISKAKIKNLEDVVSKLTNLVPLLEGITTKSKHKILVKYYEGINKIKEAYENELEQSKNLEGLSFAGSLDHIYDYFPHSYWDQWNKQYIKANNNSRMLVDYSKLAKEATLDDAKYNRQTRYINRFPLKVNIDIFGNSVLIVSFEDEFAIWIESGVLANSYRILFNSLWAQAKEFK